MWTIWTSFNFKNVIPTKLSLKYFNLHTFLEHQETKRFLDFPGPASARTFLQIFWILENRTVAGFQ